MDRSKFILTFIDPQNSVDMLKDFFENGGERGVIFSGLSINSELVECFHLLKTKGYFPLGVIIDPSSDETEFVYQRHPNQVPNDKLLETENTKSLEI